VIVRHGWSLLFAVVMFACLMSFVVAPFVGWWLPPQLSTHASRIDGLFYIILFITGFFFILTETLLIVFMWRFAAPPDGKPHVFGHHAMEKKVFWTSFFKRMFRPVSAFLHNQHRVEMAWTLVPAAILLYIAFAQVGTWADVKYTSRQPPREEKTASPCRPRSAPVSSSGGFATRVPRPGPTGRAIRPPPMRGPSSAGIARSICSARSTMSMS